MHVHSCSTVTPHNVFPLVELTQLRTVLVSSRGGVGVVPYDFNTTYSCTAKNTLRTVLTPRTVTGRVLLTVRGLTTVRYRILS